MQFNIKKACSGKEKIYFLISSIVSLLVWIALGAGIFGSFSELEKDAPAYNCVFVQAVTGKLIPVTVPTDAIPGEDKTPAYFIPEGACLDKDELTSEERTQVEKTAEREQLPSIISLLTSLIVLYQIFGAFISIAVLAKNGAKVSEQQFPEIWHTYRDLAQQMGIKKVPDLYIINARMMNAFAVKLAKWHVIVLYSDIVEALGVESDPRELAGVLAHELGHHRLKHTSLLRNIFLMPSQFILPLSFALTRGQELSADRVAAMTVGVLPPLEQAWAKLVVGKVLSQKLSIEGLLAQQQAEHGFWLWIASFFLTHPQPAYRIRQFRKFFQENDMIPPTV